MKIVADVLVAAVALTHLYILVLEMFLWRTPRGRAVFDTTPEFADATATMAGNQGLYNGFLAAGLLWGLITDHAAFQFKLFFLTCVIIAGLYGAATGVRRALFGQSIPAALAAAAVLIAG
ncbi:MAG: DUF1304 domain-containing protein [Catenulispora sp.]|nr:DUF1304 domain-containing protein [Catenulispora sp.]